MLPLREVKPPDSIPPEVRGLCRKGAAALQAGRVQAALKHLSAAAQKAPEAPAVLQLFADVCHQAGEVLTSLRLYDRVIQLGGATAVTWRATGNALLDVGEYAQAVGAFERALALAPEDAESHQHLSRALYRLGEIDSAIAELELASRCTDSMAPWLSLASVGPGSPTASPGRILEVRRACAGRLALAERCLHARPEVRRDAGSPLRIGYVSSWFHAANYMKPVWGLIRHHDRSAFEFHLFSDSPLPKPAPEPLRPEDHVHLTKHLDNRQLARRIAALGIDILVDLNAFSTPARLPLWLAPPAPVTVGWFNSFATSGLAGFDYLIGDDAVIHPGDEAWFSERLLRLPLSYLAWEVQHPVPPVQSPPCLREGRFTFGSLVSQYKITPGVLDTWACILREAPAARLLLANASLKSPHNQAWLKERFAARGVGDERLVLRGGAEHLDFLRNYDEIDVALDAFPYNGGTTTMEAVWQGVPVLTFSGDRWASRTSCSILHDTHLGEFVAADLDGYTARAVALANDPAIGGRLASLRETMRERLADSRACATAELAREMEVLYRRVWANREE